MFLTFDGGGVVFYGVCGKSDPEYIVDVLRIARIMQNFIWENSEK